MKSSSALFSVLILFSAIPLCAESQTYSLSGAITVHRQGNIKLMVYNEATFGRDQGRDALYTLTLTAEGTGSDAVSVPFALDAVPKGMYCMICFLDANGNGVLDKGLFGPTEPMSFYRKKTVAGRPQFKDIAFSVDGDVADILVELK